MNVKSQDSPKPWVDPDDAPELTQDFFEQGEWKIGDQPVSAQAGAAALREALSRGRPKAQSTKQALTYVMTRRSSRPSKLPAKAGRHG